MTGTASRPEAMAKGIRPPRRGHSLLGRLALAMSAIAAVCLGVSFWMLDATLDRVVWAEHERGLHASAAPIEAALAQGGMARLRAAPLPAVTRRRFDAETGSMRFAVLDPDGQPLGFSPGAEEVLPRLGPDGVPPASFRDGERGALLWGLTWAVRTPDGPVLLQVAQDMSRSYIVLDDVPVAALAPVLLVLGVTTLLLLAANLICALLLLAPLRRIARAVEALRPGRAAALPEAGAPVEVRPLIRAVNAAFARAEGALGRQRAFSADVAHELRTPLAVLMAEVEMMEASPAVRRLRADLAGLAQVVQDLLESAEAMDGAAGADAVADLAAVAEGVVARLAPLAERDGRLLRLHGAGLPQPVRAEAAALARAVGNLVDNAIRHTAPGTAVEVTLAAPGTLSVADRGPGVPPANRQRVFQRHWRAERAGRTGLGLAIVARIAEVHGGSVHVEDNPGGGARFVLALPPA